MKISKSRYTESQYKGFGYNCSDEDYFLPPQSREEQENIVLGQFKNIIKVLFSSSDGSLDSNPASLLTENSPEPVRVFAQNFLLKELPAARSAPDDDTAFDMLIPRSAQTSVELAPYVDFLKSEISSKLNQNGEDTPTT